MQSAGMFMNIAVFDVWLDELGSDKALSEVIECTSIHNFQPILLLGYLSRASKKIAVFMTTHTRLLNA